MKYNELLDKLEESFKSATPSKFRSVPEALKVVSGGLKYLIEQCEKEDDKKSSKSTDIQQSK